MVHVNKELISLKCVLFLFFVGLGCLYPFLPLHMFYVGLNVNEAQIISIVSPCVALLGPLIFGPLADKLAESSTSEKDNKHGKCLRIIIATVLIFGAVFYGLLLLVPSTIRMKSRNPQVSFACDTNGGYVIQERCIEDKTCYNFDENTIGLINLRNCRYACHVPPIGQITNASNDKSTIFPNDSDYDYNEDDAGGYSLDSQMPFDSSENVRRRKKRQNDDIGLIEPPHLCYKENNDIILCRVYSEYTKEITIKVKLKEALTPENREQESICRYPIAGFFTCRINENLEKKIHDPTNCKPVISCDINDPYNPTISLLAESQCMKIIGDPDLTFWLYLTLRSIADIFPTAAIALLCAATVIATRETSTGRGDVGKQFTWGIFGFAISAPTIGLFNNEAMPEYPEFSLAFFAFIIFMVLAAIVILLSSKMPLSPPEWWWHTKCGMLALPMSTIRKYGMETGALILVLITLGIFWSALDSYLPWHLKELSSTPFLIGVSIFIGAFSALPFLWFAEKIIDFCGHSNLLIVAFIAYIIRFSGLSVIKDPSMILILESLEVFSLFLMWITAVLYLRHLVPRKFTATGQALAVIAHFCLGRCIGALIGAVIDSEDAIYTAQCMYKWLSVAAVLIAVLYFLLYYLYLKPNCAAPLLITQARHPITILQGANVGSLGNGNGIGSYTPLRVYHNSKARKGQFRY